MVNEKTGAELLAQPGSITAYGGTSAPTGWFLCDGTAVSRTIYAALFAAIGTAFGVGDGSTTFNLPDLRGRFPLGKSTAGTGSTLGGTGGAIDHTHAISQANGTFIDTAGTDPYVVSVTTPTVAANPPFQAVNYIIKT